MSKGWPWNNLREIHSPFPHPHPTKLLGALLHLLWVHVHFLQSTGLECTYHSIYPCVCLITVYCLSLGSIGAGIGYDFSNYWVLSTWYSIWHKVNTKWTRTSVNELALYLRAISVTVIMHLLLFALSPCNFTHSLTLLKICVLGIYVHTYIRSDQSLSCVRLFATPWIKAHQASLSITNPRSSLRLMSIE